MKFLFRQLMMSLTSRFIFDHSPKHWPTGEKRGEDGIQKFKYLENKKIFLDEIKSIFHNCLAMNILRMKKAF